jgi:predicted ester cyclase
MANQQNEAIVRRVMDLVSQPQLQGGFEQLFDSNWHNNSPMLLPRGPEGFRAVYNFWHQSFSDFQMILEKVFSGGDHVATYFTIKGTHTGEFLGFQPTGRSFEVRGTGIHYCKDGKLIESWITSDWLSILQQLGVVQLPGQSQTRAA